MTRNLLALILLFWGSPGISQTLLFHYDSPIDFDADAYQYGQAYYLGPSFVGLKIIAAKWDEDYNHSRLAIFDLKGNLKWVWNAASKQIKDFYVEVSPTGSFWVKGYSDNGEPPGGELYIYDKKNKIWLQSLLGQEESVNFLALGSPNQPGLCTVTKNQAGKLSFSVYRY